MLLIVEEKKTKKRPKYEKLTNRDLKLFKA